MLGSLKFKNDSKSGLPKYQRLADCLEEWIRENDLKPGTKFPSDRQLSEYLKAAPITVNKSLNMLTKKGILERKVGSGTYISDASNAAPAYRRIGMICHEPIMGDPVYVEPVTTAFYDYWKGKGYQVVSLQGRPEHYERLIHEYCLAGIMILLPLEEFAGDIRRLSAAGVRLVTVGGYAIPELSDISLGTNHIRTGERVVEYLHGLGHEHIGFIANGPELEASILRHRGYANSMWQARLPVKPEWRVVGTEYSELKQKIAELHGSSDRPTAYIIGALSSAITVYNVMNELKIVIGKDVSLISFDDVNYLLQLKPALTVFKQRIGEFTTVAASQLESMIRRKALKKVCREEFEPVLLERGSCYKLK